jgi:hypothetical protein
MSLTGCAAAAGAALFPASTSEETARRRCAGLTRRSGLMAEEAGKEEGALSPPDLAGTAGARNLAAVKDAAAISSASAGRLRWCARRNAADGTRK